LIDGLGTGGGRIQARIAGDTASVVQGGVPWVFYGANPEYGYRLRLAKLGPTYSYQTLDGAGGSNGRTTDSVATDISASRLGTTLHVFYRDDTSGDLRHAWLSGGVWQFETLDGQGGASGRTTDDVGTASFTLPYKSQLNVFYADRSAGTLRRAVFDGVGWQFSVVDGDSLVGGRTNAHVGGAIRAAVWGKVLHVLYTQDPTGVREAKLSGSTWSYATISGHGSFAGPLALLRVSDTDVHAAYVENRDRLFSAHWNGSAWSVDNIVSSVDGGFLGVTLFNDGPSPVLAAGIVFCYGSGGCDDLVGTGRWNGSGFDDPYGGGAWISGDPPGNPSSAVTVNGVGELFVGGFGYESELDIFDQALSMVQGPF